MTKPKSDIQNAAKRIKRDLRIVVGYLTSEVSQALDKAADETVSTLADVVKKASDKLSEADDKRKGKTPPSPKDPSKSK